MAVSPLSLMTGNNDPETYRQKLALMLAQGGLDASPIRSPWQGAARMAQALLAGMQYKSLKDENSDEKYANSIDSLLGKKPTTELSSVTAPLLPSAPSAETPSAAPMQPSSGGGPVDRMASISAAGETGNPDISAKLGQIANDTGGSKSYGPFGLNSWAKGGDVGATSIGKFAREHGGPLGLTATPGTPEFDSQWKAAAASNPDALKAANMAWYQKNIASGVTPKLGQIGVPQEMASDPRVQGYFADRSIQYGPASVEKHASRVAQALNGANGDVPTFLRGMSAADRQNIPGDFRSYLATNPNNTRGLNNRIGTRESLAMDMARELNGGQLPINAQPTAGAFPSGPFGDVSGLGGNAPPQMTPFMPPPNMAQMQPPMAPQQGVLPPQAAPAQGAMPPVGAVPSQAAPRVAQQPNGPARVQLSLPPEIEARVRELGKKRETYGKAIELLHEYSKPPSANWQPIIDAQGNKIGIRDSITGDEKASPESNSAQQDYRWKRQNWQQFGLPDPNSKDPKAQDWWRTAAEQVGGKQQVTIDQRAPNAFETKYGEGIAEQALATVKAGSTAVTDIHRARMVQTALAGIETGNLTPMQATIGGYLQSVGLDPSYFGIDPKLPMTAQSVNSALNQMTLSKIGGQGGMPANNFSNTDRGFLVDIFPKISNQPEANDIISEVNIRLSKLQVEKSTEWAKDRKAGKSYEDFEHGWQEKMQDRDIFSDLATRLGGSKTQGPDMPKAGQQAGGAQTGTPAPGATPPPSPTMHWNPKTGEKIDLSPDGKSWVPVK